jgi:alkylation response protein AidB-like acyl-CoA dehydrogenase
LLGDPSDERQRLIGLLEADGWDAGEPQEPFRLEVRAFITDQCSSQVLNRVADTGTNHDWSFHKSLGEAGYLSRGWPECWGGVDGDPADPVILYEELGRVGAPDDGRGISELVAHTLAQVGTEYQRDLIIPAILRGDLIVALGYSEPDAGSDVAAVMTSAARDGDSWVINGQKVFTSLAHEAGYIFLLARTDPHVPKHRGLTMFLVPTDVPGFELSPIYTLGGERTNMTFYTDVRVPDLLRVGEVDGGWRVMNVALAFERQPTANQHAGRLLAHSVEYARAVGRLQDPRIVAVLSDALLATTVGRLLGRQIRAATERGEIPLVQGSMAKLFASEELVRCSALLLEMLGSDGVLARGAPDAFNDGHLEHAFRHAPLMTIYGGTSEIQRGIIAEHYLELPRTR